MTERTVNKKRHAVGDEGDTPLLWVIRRYRRLHRARNSAAASPCAARAPFTSTVKPCVKKIRVHRLACIVDCGTYVNPDTVEAQMQGAMIYGLTAALYGEITIDKGRVAQNNFYDYPMVHLAEAPHMDVQIVQNTENPGGVGEPGTPPLAPAVANALFAATGTRVRSLPLVRHGFTA